MNDLITRGIYVGTVLGALLGGIYGATGAGAGGGRRSLKVLGMVIGVPLGLVSGFLGMAHLGHHYGVLHRSGPAVIGEVLLGVAIGLPGAFVMGRALGWGMWGFIVAACSLGVLVIIGG